VETRHSRRNCRSTLFSSLESLFPGFESLFRNGYAVADKMPHFCGRGRGFTGCEGRAPPSRVFGDRKALNAAFHRHRQVAHGIRRCNAIFEL